VHNLCYRLQNLLLGKCHEKLTKTHGTPKYSHQKSDFYFVDDFLKERTSLNSIELELLGDIKNKTVTYEDLEAGEQKTVSLEEFLNN